MGCVLCNLIQISEAHEPFPSESARQDFMNELAGDIAQNHPELVEKINEGLGRGTPAARKVNHPDMVFLANRINTFVDLVQDPQGYFNRNPDVILPKSLDLKITAAALYLLVDCYLRGQGLKTHPRSSTQMRAVEALAAVMEAVDQEVATRPYMYPKLNGALGRGKAAVELDFTLQGFSFWATGDEDV